jgi:beta-lactam-binding protein with PASTA domain
MDAASGVRRWGHGAGVALAVVGLALILLGFGAGTQRAQVPWVLGRSEAQAVKRIERHDLRAEVLARSGGAKRLSDRFRIGGHVVFQSYRGGITLPRGTTVRLMVYPLPTR